MEYGIEGVSSTVGIATRQIPIGTQDGGEMIPTTSHQAN